MKESRNTSTNIDNKEIKSLSKSLYFSAFLLAIMIMFFIISHFSYDGSSWYDSLFISSIIYFGLAGFWVLFRLGLGEAWLLKAKNYNNTKSARKVINKTTTPKMSIEEYREERKKKDWIGPLISLTLAIVLIIIASLFSFL